MVLWKPSHLLSAVFAGQERFRGLAAITAGGSVVSSCAGLAVVALTRNAVGYVAVSCLTSAAVGIVMWQMSHLKFNRTALDIGLWKRLVGGGLPFLGWSLVLRVYGQSDNVLLAFLSTEAAIGWYAAAYKIISIPLFVPALISAPLLPVLSRCASDHAAFQRTLRRSILAAMLVVIPLSVLLIALAPVIPGLLGWPGAFQNAVPLMMILALHEPIVAADIMLGTALVALRRETPWLWVGVVAALFNPAANLVLIPFFQHSAQNGAIGAAIVTVLTEMVMLGGALLLLRGSVGAFQWDDVKALAKIGRDLFRACLARLSPFPPRH
jgi:O-antigen/teichoic acid export membrane protein